MVCFYFGMMSGLVYQLGNGHVFYHFFTNSCNISRIFPESSTNLSTIYERYDGTNQFDHWKEYAGKYELNLSPLLRELSPEKTFRMLEIGVQSGGSVNVWKSYFARPFYYVGMDIDERCKRSEDVNQNIFIEIGSQMDPKDLLFVCKNHGPFHFIVDDGGHTFEMIKTSLKTLFPSDECMAEKSLYVIEDMHTMVFKEYISKPTDIPSIPGELFRKMHNYWYAKRSGTWDVEFLMDKEWTDRIGSITLYDSMMFIRHQHGHSPLTRITNGTSSFSNQEKKLQPKEYGKPSNIE